MLQYVLSLVWLNGVVQEGAQPLHTVFQVLGGEKDDREEEDEKKEVMNKAGPRSSTRRAGKTRTPALSRRKMTKMSKA